MRRKAKAAIPLALALALGAASPAHAIDAGSTIALSQPSGFGGLLGATAANSLSTNQSTSADGNKVVFASRADGLSPDDNDAVANIYLRDRAAHTTTLISRSTSGDPANRDSFNPVISADGSRVAFASNASNLVADDG